MARSRVKWNTLRADQRGGKRERERERERERHTHTETERERETGPALIVMEVCH